MFRRAAGDARESRLHGHAGNETSSTEAEGLARYVLGAAASPVILERYERAARTLFPDAPTDEDLALGRFVERRPWSLPLLDAALGLVRPDALLRRKLVVMLACVETTPEHVGRFEPHSGPWPVQVLRLAGYGLLAASKALVGLPVYYVARRGS